MDKKNNDSDRAKVISRLTIARDLITALISEPDLMGNWIGVHRTISLAREQILAATKIIAQRHVRVCVLEQDNNGHARFTQNSTDEIIKTFNYLS